MAPRYEFVPTFGYSIRFRYSIGWMNGEGAEHSDHFTVKSKQIILLGYSYSYGGYLG